MAYRSAEADPTSSILKPKRVIFNPGTVNPEFMGRLKREGIEPISECMLVMLSEEEF
jgi:hypothetical protein